MPTQKRTLKICYARGASIGMALVAARCAKKLARNGQWGEAADALEAAATGGLKALEYYIYTYDRPALTTTRDLQEYVAKAAKAIRSTKADKAANLVAIDRINQSLTELEKRVQATCIGKLPGYAGR